MSVLQIAAPRRPTFRRGVFTALAALLAMPIAAVAENLRVIVSNVKSDQGSMVVWVYAGPDRWLSDDVFLKQDLPVAGNRAGDTVTLQLALPPGEYALSVFQDVDGNGEMARNFMGIPKEPAGLSNNAVARFGPPKYKDAKFEIADQPVEQRIKLN